MNITRRATIVATIVATDRAAAVEAAEASTVAASCELAPLSYEQLRAADRAERARLLAAVPAELRRAQAVRFLVERFKLHGTAWGWGDVDSVAATFERVAAEVVPAPAPPPVATAVAASPAAPTMATVPATSPVLVDEVLARRQREARAEQDRAQLAGDADAARFARERHDAVARARRYLGEARAAGRTLVRQLPVGDWQVVGSRGTPYSLIVGEGLRLFCSCPHGERLRAGQAVVGQCWHADLVAACEEVAEWEIEELAA